MKRNLSESATVVAHRADGMAPHSPDRPVPLRGDVHGQPVHADWDGSRPEDAIEGVPQDHLIAKTLDRCVGRSLHQQAKGRTVLLTSFETGAFTNGLPVLCGAAAVLFACMSIGFAGAAPVAADPDAAPAVNGQTDPVADAGPPPPPVDDGRVASTPPVTTKSPDGWTLTVSAHDETEMPVPSLTNEAGTREYIVGGVFNGSVRAPAGAGPPHGTFEVGYQIACQADTRRGVLSGGFNVEAPVDSHVLLTPAVVTNVPVAKKEFKGADPWVMISGYSIKIDGGFNSYAQYDDSCKGQAFIRSYATLTASTDASDVSQSYYGTIKAM